MSGDDLGDRMKEYERTETSRRLDVHLPIYARIDGRSFSSFTKGMERPFDGRMMRAMVETTKYLVEESHARIGYTQSDEISLVWMAEAETSDIFFSGKIQKLASVLASLAAAKFGRVCPAGFEDRLPAFDARVFQLPSIEEAANAILWRALDARKNAIQMVARHHFSHKQLHRQGEADMREMLIAKGVDFEAFPAWAKFGTFVRRETVLRSLEEVELAAIPEIYRPTEPVWRSETKTWSEPFFGLLSNRAAVIFGGAVPSRYQDH